jgi:hypothetical protein
MSRKATDIPNDEQPEVIAPGALQPGTVPLTFNGVVVGSATVDENGAVTQILWDGKEPIEVEHVGADILMAKPKYNVTITGGSNMQFGNGNTQVNHF